MATIPKHSDKKPRMCLSRLSKGCLQWFQTTKEVRICAECREFIKIRENSDGYGREKKLFGNMGIWEKK